MLSMFCGHCEPSAVCHFVILDQHYITT